MCSSFKSLPRSNTTQNITPTIPNHAAGSLSPPVPASAAVHPRRPPGSPPPSLCRSSRLQYAPTHSELPPRIQLTPSQNTPANLFRILLHLHFSIKRQIDPQKPLSSCSRSSSGDSTTFFVELSSVRSLSSSPILYSRRQVGHILLFALLLLYHIIFIQTINFYY